MSGVLGSVTSDDGKSSGFGSWECLGTTGILSDRSAICVARFVFLLLLRMKMKASAAMPAMAATPPTAPPTMAPVGVELPPSPDDGVAVTAAVVGFTVIVANVVEVGVAVIAVLGTDHVPQVMAILLASRDWPT